MNSYAFGLYDLQYIYIYRYNLKGNVKIANTNIKSLGYGISDQVFDDMDRGFHNFKQNGENFTVNPKKSDK